MYAGYPPAFFGLFAILGGTYSYLLSPQTMTPRGGEAIVFQTEPTQWVAGSKSVGGLALASIGVWGIAETSLPLAYPVCVSVVGVWFYTLGLTRLWRNSLTKYYVTTDRVVETYQLLSVTQKTMPQRQVQGIEKRKTLIERLLSVGHVRIESAGDTGTSRIIARNIRDPTQLVNAIRE
ncbi:hypothetical protein C499_06080 [Halogeometricum borinquense DSM 11551]|uniref:Uncharacterized conserved protein n=2 Tax=Halogeometricum borinquense TaxID=60847 RepID=E4NVA7_HALBP|nr:uncharacterized conserved protein [Halogeometricum borinquense DSM 11551]ELY29403.1 hypothetical protein C499_06080 [Halogeometricum borinquense DSM 11551]